MSDELSIVPEDDLRSLTRRVRELLDVYRNRRPGSLYDRHFLATRILSLSQRLESFRPHDSPEAPSGPADVRDLCGYQLNLLSRIFVRHFVRGRPKPRPRDVRRIFFLAWLGGLCNRLRTVCALSAVSAPGSGDSISNSFPQFRGQCIELLSTRLLPAAQAISSQ